MSLSCRNQLNNINSRVNMEEARNNNVNNSSSSATNNQTTNSETRTITEIKNLEVLLALW